MQVVEKRIAELQPYENNPRRNDDAVPYVAESIKRYGFKVPIVIDKDGLIVAGHTRYLASIELGIETVPCIVADDLTDEQVKAFRLVDNKVAEYSSWDLDALQEELLSVANDLTQFGLTTPTDTKELAELTDELFEDEKEFRRCPHCGCDFYVVNGEAQKCE